MLRDDARKIAEAIDERVNADAADKAVTTTVETSETRPEGVPRGAARPTFYHFRIQISDGKRFAYLELGQAEMLLDSLEPGCDADRVFEAIRGQDVPIEDAPIEDAPQ
ncbi:MAG: hypothetical protein M3R63_12770 [Actinomycetota bacterium]|nr:hypothetical protein [Actinomycetota bacterium]